MKREINLILLVGLVVTLTMVILTGCGTTKSTDEAFLEDMQAGLEARWDLVDEDKEKAKDEDKDYDVSKERWEEYVDAEYDKISKYEDEKFEDKDLGKTAKEYIDLIKESKDSLKYYSNDSKFNSANWEIHEQRAYIIYQLNKEDKLNFDDKYQDSLDGMIDDGKTYKAVQDIMSKVDFKKTEDDYGWKIYSMVLENTSDADFDYFQINVNLNDADGVTIETDSAYTENWAAGSKHKFEFETDADFKDIEIVSSDWGY